MGGRRCGRLRRTFRVGVDERIVSVDSSEPNAQPPGAVQARHIAQAVKALSREKSFTTNGEFFGMHLWSLLVISIRNYMKTTSVDTCVSDHYLTGMKGKECW
jgi:hypothetical protein